MKDQLIIVHENEDVYNEEITSIVESINEYSKLNKLKYKFKRSENNKAPDVLARDGYLIVRIRGNDMLWVYLPQIVSDNQIRWLNDNKSKLKKINTVGVFNYKEDNQPENLMSVIELMNEAEEKNKKYKRK